VPLKYLGFSTGDHTLSAFLMAFDKVDSQCNIKKLANIETKGEECLQSPDPAANIRIELSTKHIKGQMYPDLYVRTFYNNKHFKFCESNQEYCPLHEFLDIFTMQTITTHEGSICGASDALIAPNSHFFVIIALLILLIYWIRNKVVEDDEK
jgi:hypothetical protein